jgi:hypothetical protein
MGEGKQIKESNGKDHSRVAKGTNYQQRFF